jgi:hypothetical protein
MNQPSPCPNCRGLNSPGAPFCALCGRPLVAIAPKIPRAAPIDIFNLLLAIASLILCGPVGSIPAYFLALYRRDKEPEAVLPKASYWISLGSTILWLLIILLFLFFYFFGRGSIKNYD